MADEQLRNVVKRYGNYDAVRGISLEIPDTKFVDSGMSSAASGEKARVVANMTYMHLIDPATDAVI
jgi:ABC-type histidine transport system ATPase subunit